MELIKRTPKPKLASVPHAPLRSRCCCSPLLLNLLAGTGVGKQVVHLPPVQDAVQGGFYLARMLLELLLLQPQSTTGCESPEWKELLKDVEK